MFATSIILAILLGIFIGAFTICASALYLIHKDEETPEAGWYPDPMSDLPPPNPAERYTGPLDENGYPLIKE